jgi:outer membrane protein OmpA-like peptidoglycan-associated protein
MVGTLVVGLAGGSIGCSSKAGTGGLIGAATGAAAGAIIGNQTGNTAAGAILGAAVGGMTGAAIGRYMDKQAAELESDLAGAKIERVGEGIKVTFDSGILFDYDSHALQGAAQSNLTNLATILNKYDDTIILVEGHTDAQGADDYNMDLSRRRANSVSAYLSSLQVDSGRFTVMGYGERQPIADNGTDWGRALNRRVELAIMANDELKEHLAVDG